MIRDGCPFSCVLPPPPPPWYYGDDLGQWVLNITAWLSYAGESTYAAVVADHQGADSLSFDATFAPSWNAPMEAKLDVDWNGEEFSPLVMSMSLLESSVEQYAASSHLSFWQVPASASGEATINIGFAASSGAAAGSTSWTTAPTMGARFNLTLTEDDGPLPLTVSAGLAHNDDTLAFDCRTAWHGPQNSAPLHQMLTLVPTNEFRRMTKPIALEWEAQFEPPSPPYPPDPPPPPPRPPSPPPCQDMMPMVAIPYSTRCYDADYNYVACTCSPLIACRVETYLSEAQLCGRPVSSISWRDWFPDYNLTNAFFEWDMQPRAYRVTSSSRIWTT